MSEADMKRRVLKALKPLDGQSIQCAGRPGIPDVNCSAGWLELKWVKKWPKNAAHSAVLLPHFTQEQRIWLARRCARGGKAWLLLCAQGEWLLFPGRWAAEHVGNVTQEILREAAVPIGPDRGLNEELFRLQLTRP